MMHLLIDALILATVLAKGADAGPFNRRAATDAGATSTDLYPPPNATLNTALFPGQSQIGSVRLGNKKNVRIDAYCTDFLEWC